MLIYLGAPIAAGRFKGTYVRPIVEKIRKHIDSWGFKFLSMVGRLTLVKSELCSIPLHILTVLKVLLHVIDEIDRLLRDFLWGSKDGRKLCHWVR